MQRSGKIRVNPSSLWWRDDGVFPNFPNHLCCFSISYDPSGEVGNKSYRSRKKSKEEKQGGLFLGLYRGAPPVPQFPTRGAAMTRIRENVRIEETARAGVYRARRVDLVERWLIRGVVTDRQHAVAHDFALTFEAALLRERFTLSGWNMDKVDGARGDADHVSVSVLNARKRMEQARRLLGTSMWPVVADVIGSGLSLREHAQRASSGVHRVTHHEARGRLLAALDVLERGWA